MKKEEFCDALGGISEIYIQEARTISGKRRSAWIKWGSAAACLALLFLFAVPLLRNQSPAQGSRPQPGGISGTNETQIGTETETSVPAQTAELFVNEADSMTNMDLDVQLVRYDTKLSKDAWDKVLDDFHAFTGITYNDLIGKLPDTWTVSSFYSLSAPEPTEQGVRRTYRLHDYVLEFETGQGGSAVISLCSFEEPLRDCFIVCDNPKQSVIQGTSLVIYGYADSYMVQFSHQNVNYDIETSFLSFEELEELLSGIIGDSDAS